MVAKTSPPPGPPWDLPLAEAPLAFVDLEMTGLDPAKDRVVEVCVERVVGAEVVARLHTLVRPDGGEIGNVHVHGLGAEVLADAPTFPQIVDEVVRLLDGAIFVAHGASWDVAFVEAETKRSGKPFEVGFWLDTLNLSRRALGLPKHSLEALRAHFGLDASRAHRADADVAALREVWRRCLAAFDPQTPRDIWEVRIAERRAREHIVDECRRAVAFGGPVEVHYRPRARPAETFRAVFTSVDTTREPPRACGYELPGRGRRELRADRILRIEGLPEVPDTERTGGAPPDPEKS